MRIALLASTLMLSVPALGHDLWINKQGYRNPAGEWCCGEGDCGVMVFGRVGETRSGYSVDATFRIGDGAGSSDREVHEVVPYTEVLPSLDGRYWRCQRPDGSRRCFIGPPPAM